MCTLEKAPAFFLHFLPLAFHILDNSSQEDLWSNLCEQKKAYSMSVFIMTAFITISDGAMTTIGSTSHRDSSAIEQLQWVTLAELHLPN